MADTLQDSNGPPGEPGVNQRGRAQAITVMTPMRGFLHLRLRLLFWLINHYPPLTAPLRKLSFIHFARWNLLSKIPYNGGTQRKETLHHTYLVFTSNFNGTWDQYIDAFVDTVREQMDKIWGSSYGFPGAYPSRPFEDYIRFNEYACSHFYSPYPDATTTDILHAVELERLFPALIAASETLDPNTFKAVYDQFLTKVQHLL